MTKALGFWISFGLLASSGRVITFDRAAVGHAPAGWTVAMTHAGADPRWEVRQDNSAPSPPYVLAQISADRHNDRYPLAIFDGVSLRDCDVSVRIKPVSGLQDQAGGVVWRYRDPNNYYLARANAVSKNVAIYKVTNGERLPIATAVPHDIEPNTWNILKVSVRGSRFQVYVNHRRILQADDKTFSGPGRLGLWTVADSVTYFDDFRVYPK
ncbi:MAG TPA: hypothetical protein VGE89_06235 [Bryobacteraceae bacterium]|jgi:hypothetical protein